ncbi:camp-dependent protein kinase regulatory subunit [Chytriomyces sp. MP71]|nr:camp-dependent protein kinase regulatory subunit [Chytriomyces sp. MP71]
MGEADQFAVPAEFPEILKDLNREVLRAQPKDIYQFCATYFHQKLAEQRKELIELASGISGGEDNEEQNNADKEEVTGKEAEKEAAKDAQKDSDDEDSDDEDDQPAMPPPPPPNHNRGRRTSVSAESMAPSLDKDFVAVVIPKTDEQKARIQSSIKNNFLFRSCDEEQYRDVVDAMAEKKVPAGEEVIRQGGVGDYFYVVETGSLDVFVSKGGNPPVKVYEYGDGGSFGELALMYNAPRAATVVATSACVLWALDRVTFRRILMDHTSRKRRMYEGFLEEVKLLASLEPYERHKIADVLESQTFNDGDVVIKQGDVGEQFYIIESGEASVTKMIEGVEHQYPGLKKGDYFGELALLTDQPRQATIRASGRLKVATMGKKAFVRLLGPVVDIIKRNANDYAQIKSHINN